MIMSKEKVNPVDLAKRYPQLGQELISEILGWWEGDDGVFIVPLASPDLRTGGTEAYLDHSEVFDRKCYTREEIGDDPELEGQEKKRAHNRQLLGFLRTELGWHEDDERFYPSVD